MAAESGRVPILFACTLLAGCMGNGDPLHDGIFWNEKAAQARQASLLTQNRLTWAEADEISNRNTALRNRLADQRSELAALKRRAVKMMSSTDPTTAAKAAVLAKNCEEASGVTDPRKTDLIIRLIRAEMDGLASR
jgi:hypothetical protein